MQFSIITPSFRSSRWLKLCIPSVADQEVELEHIVQDSLSDDGTLEWLPQDTRVKAYIEKDSGMYDAVNRGFRKARGEILAYLNADEQYLPGALAQVQKYFEDHPDAEIVFADAVVVDGAGEFRCFRKVHIPERYHALLWALCTLTCSTFIRRSVLEKHDHFFDPSWRIVGDVDWVVRALDKKIRMKVFRHYTSTFTETGGNLSLHPAIHSEKKRLRERAGKLAPRIAPFYKLKYQARRFFQGGYWEKPFTYSIYTEQSLPARKEFRVDHPKALWPRSIAEPNPAPV